MINQVIKTVFFLCMLSANLSAYIQVENKAIAGGVAVIDFQSKSENPLVFYNQTAIFTQKINQTHWQALVGIPLLTKAGKKTLTVYDPATRSVDFTVQKHDYPSQYITLKGDKKKYVNPLAKHMTRIQKETPILTKARKIFSDKQTLSGTFLKPVAGIISSPFGLKRFYNNQARRPHTGLDIAATTGSQIRAPIAGKVILAGDYFFNGKTVFLDHGQGLISLYIHMDKIEVKVGDTLKRGETIGLVGQTGRSTGPHLHWGVYLNTTAVDPTLFMAKQ